jgi:hypothetical protein
VKYRSALVGINCRTFAAETVRAVAVSGRSHTSDIVLLVSSTTFSIVSFLGHHLHSIDNMSNRPSDLFLFRRRPHRLRRYLLTPSCPLVLSLLRGTKELFLSTRTQISSPESSSSFLFQLQMDRLVLTSRRSFSLGALADVAPFQVWEVRD